MNQRGKGEDHAGQPAALFEHGRQALTAGRLDEAARYLDAAVAACPGQAVWQYNAGLAQHRRGELELALPHYEAADRLAGGASNRFPATLRHIPTWAWCYAS